MGLSRILTYTATLYVACAITLMHGSETHQQQPQSIQTGTPFFQQQPVSLNEMQLALRLANMILATQTPQQPQSYWMPSAQGMPCAYPIAQQSTASTPAPTNTPTNLTILFQPTTEVSVKSDTNAQNTSSSDAQQKASNGATNKNKGSAAGGVGSGGTGTGTGTGGDGTGGDGTGGDGTGGDGTGGDGTGGDGGSAENRATGGSGGDGGKGGNSSNDTTHNDKASSFPFADHFNPDKLREKSKGIWHTCKKHAYKIAGISALGTYGYLYYRISSAKSVLKDKESWCNWHKEKNNSQLFTSSQLINELMFEIATRYSDIMQPQNAALPVQTFFSTINQELKELKRFAKICTWLKRLHITAIFPVSDKHMQSCTEKIERLEALRNVVIQHVTQQQYASIATRGFSIPIRLPSCASQENADQKTVIKKRSS